MAVQFFEIVEGTKHSTNVNDAPVIQSGHDPNELENFLDLNGLFWHSSSLVKVKSVTGQNRQKIETWHWDNPRGFFHIIEPDTVGRVITLQSAYPLISIKVINSAMDTGVNLWAAGV